MVFYAPKIALVAQWIERWFPKPCVAGSIPAEGTKRFGSAVLVKSATIPEMSLPNVAQWSSSYVDHFDGNLIGCGLSGTPDLMILNC